MRGRGGAPRPAPARVAPARRRAAASRARRAPSPSPREVDDDLDAGAARGLALPCLGDPVERIRLDLEADSAVACVAAELAIAGRAHLRRRRAQRVAEDPR